MQATIEKRAERRTMPRKVEAKRAAVDRMAEAFGGCLPKEAAR